MGPHFFSFFTKLKMFLLLQMKAFPAGCPHVAVLTYLICSMMEPHSVLVTVSALHSHVHDDEVVSVN